MSVIALTAAQSLADDVDAWGMPVLRAMLPIAGLTLIEQQAERARAVGIGHLLVLVDGVPPALVEACDRMRARGLAVDLVRDGGDVIRLASGADRVMLVADGLVAGDQPWRTLSGANSAALLVTADDSMTQALERIDAATRWAGLALLPISRLAALDGAPADWDPQLTLFRQAVQDDVPRIACDPALFVSGDISIAQSPVAAAEVELRLLAVDDDGPNGLLRRWVITPLARLFARPLLGGQRAGKIARGLSLAASTGGMVAVALASPHTTMALAVVAATGESMADYIGK
ncbi:MAG: hypothetical protein ACKOUM_11465, partial [Sphingopyxis sp.]